jgi:hypothetical protein
MAWNLYFQHTLSFTVWNAGELMLSFSVVDQLNFSSLITNSTNKTKSNQSTGSALYLRALDQGVIDHTLAKKIFSPKGYWRFSF